VPLNRSYNLSRRHACTIWKTGTLTQAPTDGDTCSTSARAVGLHHHVSAHPVHALLNESHRIPFLYEEAYQWYPSFDSLGDLLPNPNPTPALELLMRVVTHLVNDCSWPVNRIHLFGFAQGGTVASEFAIKWWQSELARVKETIVSTNNESPDPITPRALGSVVTVCGPMLSFHNTLQSSCQTAVLVAHRPAPAESALPPNAMAAFKKAFGTVQDFSMGRGEGMPRSKDQWEPIMRFWSERLSRRPMEGLYEVMSGMTPV
jgi:pimeloyl-ACP methyl ester carboxylesterase